MQANVGNIDRAARFGLGALLIVLAVAGAVPLWVAAIGAVLAATAAVRFCPLYRLLGVCT